MARSKPPALPISLFDIFLGSGRTIRRPTGPPGFPFLQAGKTELVRVRRRASTPKKDDDESKAASAKGSNKENAASGSKHSNKKENNKSSSKKDDSKPNGKAEDAKKAADESKANGNKPQAGAQNTSDVVFIAEEDAKLLLMKTGGKSWGEIAAAIGKTKKQTTKRFGEIRPVDWKAQKGGKHGIDKAGVVDEKNDHNDKQVAKMGNKDNKVEDRKSKSNAIDKHKQEKALSAAVLLGGKLEHEHRHAHAYRHEVRHDHHHDHHVHLHDSHPRRSSNDPKPHHHIKDPRHEHTRHDSAHHPSRPHKTHHRTASIAASSRTAFTLKTMPSLAEDDLFSFGELQALSELIFKDMEGMWHRVSAAFFGMTGRRIAAEDIREKFAGLEG
ncbi:unnamed protein product [Aureobasidium vineae]|uniref:Myb-like domain-containing protein n=1 Tax=Aureobasidium vineae TaxID=2773715 RepID=A0A9N8JDP1_9PEZI|nr:unnamed protein product [Aureobasidium vineae]